MSLLRSMSGLGVESDSDSAQMDSLQSKMKKNLVVSVDRMNWAEAGRNLKWAIILRLASGKAILKEQFEGTLTKVWKTRETVTFLKMERSTLMAIFKSSEDQDEVLK